MSKLKLLCWHCGESLKDEPLPISRFAKCRGCEADLRTCLMCTKYGPDLPGQCRDDDADYVQHKDQANFCNFFRPSPFAHQPDKIRKTDSAKEELEALFGGGSESPPEQNSVQAKVSRKDKAKESLSELERMFGKSNPPKDTDESD